MAITNYYSITNTNMGSDVAKEQIKSASMFSHPSIGYMSVTSKSYHDIQDCYQKINEYFESIFQKMTSKFPDRDITLNRLYNQEFFPEDEGVSSPDNFDEDAVFTVQIHEQVDGDEPINIMSSSIFIYDVDYEDESIGKYLH